MIQKKHLITTVLAKKLRLKQAAQKQINGHTYNNNVQKIKHRRNIIEHEYNLNKNQVIETSEYL